MYNAVRKFLALHNHLALPGIGNFSVEKIPAQIDIANRTILPPSLTIKFSNEKLPAEKIFFNFLAQELNIDEVQAVRSFTDFITQLQTQIQQNIPVILKGIGVLKKQSFNIINFQAETMPGYFSALTAERVIRKNAPHLIKVGEDEKTSDEWQSVLHNRKEIIRKERWWVPAAVLACIGILGIAYYYLILH